MLKNYPSNQLQEKFHVINGCQKQEGKKRICSHRLPKTAQKDRKLMFFAQWFVPVLQNHKLVNTAVKSHLYKNLIRKKSMQKKRVRNMLFIFTKEKNRHHTSHRFFHKTSCIFCWTWESLPAGTVAADSQTQRLVYRTIAC